MRGFQAAWQINTILVDFSLAVKCKQPADFLKIGLIIRRLSFILKLMFLAVDVGGTKTLLAVFDDKGEVVEQYKFATAKSYQSFTADLKAALSVQLAHHTFKVCCCAIPGQLDKANRVALHLGNLPWQNVPVQTDLSATLNHITVLVENDAKLAGLSEAVAQPSYHKALYLTVSTGIGAGLIIDGKINEILDNSEPGQMVIEFDGQLQKWEDIASGRALVGKYGKRASEIDDPAIWQQFARGLARGMTELIAVLQPDIIILGGGVGAHFEKFAEPLEKELAELANDMVTTPPIVKAKRPEEAVIYGCYELIKQTI